MKKPQPRQIHFVLMVGWAVITVVACFAGWLRSVIFVSAVSLYANVAAHWVGWTTPDA